MIKGMRPFTYRRAVQNSSNATNIIAIEVPRHPTTALSLELVSFINNNANALTFGTNDSMRIDIILGTFAAWTSGGISFYLAQFNYPLNISGSKANAGINPAGDPGLKFSPGLRLAVADDPCLIIAQCLIGSPDLSGFTAVLHGWEFPIPDASFPQPDSVEAVL